MSAAVVVDDEEEGASRVPYRVRILIVEDNEDSREMMAEVLRQTGDPIIALAETGEEGLQQLRSGAYDFIFTDIGLPGVSGLEMLDQATHEGLLLGSEIVVVCSASYAFRQAVIARGERWLPKPVDPEKMLELVRAWSRPEPRESGPELSNAIDKEPANDV